MRKRRLPPARIAGIAAWTAASVTWGTAGVALATASGADTVTVDSEAEPVIVAAATETTLAAVPTMPESGLVVLRYSPSEKPEAPVVVRRVVVSTPSSGAVSPAPAAAAPAPAAATVTKTKSSGS